MTTGSGCYLVAAVSGRALAQSAGRGGHRVAVLDYFADQDTRAAAEACRCVVAPHALRFDRRVLLAAAAELAPAAQSAGLVYGSGFEGRTALLGRLAQGRRMCGNTPEVVAAITDPRQFFPLLQRLGVSHPEVRFQVPPDPAGWLVKQPGGAGGAQVRHASQRPARGRSYYQFFEAGRTLSVLILADGARALVLGYNEQWTTTARPGAPFLFGGAVNHVVLPPELRGAIEDRLQALVAATGLVGLNGVDFILRDSEWLVLEVNPRPTATVELYDPDYASGLFDAHLHACAGELLQAAAPPGAARAMAVVLAAAGGTLSGEFGFPAWCRDLPASGMRFAAGDPVCTVHAEAPDAAGAMALVRRRQASLEQTLLLTTAGPGGS
ncbi:MAG: ATP-grasp domain-containing protein [Gemmatimonadota bacterium]|nr:ATP-grasp domain-containing protein [Gemmatimonadota bacterium]